MANAIFQPTANASLTGTTANDVITLDMSGATGTEYSVNTGAGIDTVIFDDVLGSGGYVGVGNNFTLNGTEVVNVTGYETLIFENGTITSGASVTPEQVLGSAINTDIDTLDGFGDFNVGTVLGWNGTALTTTTGWTINSINGTTVNTGSNVSILEGGAVLGRIGVTNGNTLRATAENSFHTGITQIGAVEQYSFDVELVNGTDTFTQTLTVDVVGVASSANNTFVGTDADDGPIDALGGNDFMTGGDGADVLFGNDGDDRIFAGAGDTGADIFVGGAGNDIIGAGAGDDVLVGNGHVGAAVFGLVTDDGSNTMFGGEGNDAIAIGGYNNAGVDFGLGVAGAGNFNGAVGGTAYSGAGDDEVWGSLSGGDTIGGGAGDDIINSLGGDDVIYGAAGADIIDGGVGNDIIFAGDDDDAIIGDAGDDIIYNGNGNDVVNGGAGKDTLWGSAGDDDLTGGADADVFAFVEGNGTDQILDFAVGVDMIDLSNVTGISSISDMISSTSGGITTYFYSDDDSFSVNVPVTNADFMFA